MKMILKILKSLDTTKATGPDMIGNRIMKAAVEPNSLINGRRLMSDLSLKREALHV